MNRTQRAACFVSLLFTALSAQAQTVVLRENWETGTNQWRSTGPNAGGDIYLQDTGPTNGTAISLVAPSADTTSCTGSYVREGIGKGNESVGGRVFARPAQTISVAAGEKYCVAAWVRGAAGSHPSVGINYVKKSVGYSDTRVAGVTGGEYRSSVYREHWLMLQGGGSADGYAPWAENPRPANDTRTAAQANADIAAQQNAYGNANPVDTDGQWHLVKSWFTVTAQDLKSYQGATDVVADAFALKFGNFTGSGTAGVYSAGAKPADFGDIIVVKLDATATDCPADPFFTAQTSVHTACTGNTPFCAGTGTGLNMKFGCVACDASKGEAGTNACDGNTPICAKTGANVGSCGACTGDNGVAGQAACASANPYCTTKPGSATLGSCGKCTADADCLAASGGPNHAGVSCDIPTGACTTGCLADADCASTGGWCDGANAPTTAGKCKPKLSNGTAVPASRGGKCTTALGTLLCESGRCETSDNTCGLVSASECSDPNQCRGGVCENSKCGRADGGNCTKAAECLGNQCTAGKCGAPCASDAECGAANSGNVCDASSGACVTGCRGAGGNGCPADQACSSTSTTIGSCGAKPGSDAGASTDAGNNPTPPKDDDGGCSTSPSNGSGGALIALAVFALGLARRRAKHDGLA